MAQLARIELVKDLVQETVDRGVASVEQIHQVIAALPFDVLEALGMPGSLRLRDRQRRVIGVVYGAVRDANRYVGELISDGFEAVEDGQHVASMLGDADSVSEAARGRPSRIAERTE
jgi:hypothetical protein